MDKRALGKIERPLAEPGYLTQVLLNENIRYVVKIIMTMDGTVNRSSRGTVK